MKKQNLNYFSEKERGAVQKFTNFRTNLARPLLKLLSTLGITPNMVSALSILVMIGFIYFVNSNVYYASGFVVLHILLDSIDGSLARYKNTTSDSGALTDICVDQTVMLIGVLATIFFGIIDPFWGSLYGVAYILMIVFLVVLNQREKPVKYVVRTKYFFFLVLLFDFHFDTEIMHYFLMVFAIYMTLTSFFLFNRLRTALIETQ